MLPEISGQEINKLPDMPVKAPYNQLQTECQNIPVENHLKDHTYGSIIFFSTMISSFQT